MSNSVTPELDRTPDRADGLAGVDLAPARERGGPAAVGELVAVLGGQVHVLVPAAHGDPSTSASDAVTFIRALGSDQVDLFGFSMLGMARRSRRSSVGSSSDDPSLSDEETHAEPDTNYRKLTARRKLEQRSSSP